jgi:exosortase K
VIPRAPSVLRTALLAAALLLAAAALDRLYATLGPDEVRWLVRPAVWLVELAGGGSFEWEPGEGYLAREARLQVNQRCAGLRFLTLSATLLGLAWVRPRGGPRAVLRAALAAAGTAFAATALANALRIGVALQLRRLDLRDFGWTFAEAHQAESLAVYGVAFALLAAAARTRLDPASGKGRAAACAWPARGGLQAAPGAGEPAARSQRFPPRRPAHSPRSC